ncbi:MAG: hypothetical protein K0R34_2490 [Herbinix sp.]|jgi:hypothetical protein|nr:hypothetical protein [Herbinix sp.]
MPKRSVSKPYSKRESEQKLVNQRFYGKLENEPSRVPSVFRERPHYGIPEPGKISQSSIDI